MAARFSDNGMPFHGFAKRSSSGPIWTGKVSLIPEKLLEPLTLSQRKKIFTNSMSDTFHENLSDWDIARMCKVMAAADWHTFQVLTKRPERLRTLLNGSLRSIADSEHIWWGTSVENKETLHRIDDLRKANVRNRFLSIEPLLEDLGEIDLTGIGWVIVGGESGPGARPMEEAWVRNIQRQCLAASVPFFFKQWGGTRKKASGNKLDGKRYLKFPKTQIKQIPKRGIRQAMIKALQKEFEPKPALVKIQAA